VVVVLVITDRLELMEQLATAAQALSYLLILTHLHHCHQLAALLFMISQQEAAIAYIALQQEQEQ
jgi:hypothetical protein